MRGQGTDNIYIYIYLFCKSPPHIFTSSTLRTPSLDQWSEFRHPYCLSPCHPRMNMSSSPFPTLIRRGATPTERHHHTPTLQFRSHKDSKFGSGSGTAAEEAHRKQKIMHDFLLSFNEFLSIRIALSSIILRPFQRDRSLILRHAAKPALLRHDRFCLQCEFSKWRSNAVQLDP